MKILFPVLFPLYVAVTAILNGLGPNGQATLKLKQNEVAKDTSAILELNRRAEKLRYHYPDSIRILAQAALELSKEIAYEKGIIYATSNLALHELYQGNSEGSIAFNLENIANPRLLDFPDLAIKIYNDIGQAYFMKTDYPEAYKHFLTALELAKSHDNANEIVRMNSNLGALFVFLEDYDEAIGHFTTAQENCSDNMEPHLRAVILSNLGYLKLQKDLVAESVQHLEKAISILEDSEYSTIRAFTLLNLGEAYVKENRIEDAMRCFERAAKDYKLNEDKKGLADLYFDLSSAHLASNDHELALEYVLKSLDLYKSFNLKTGLERCYRLLYRLHKNKENINQSLHYLELAQKYADSISKAQNKANVMMLRAKMEFEAEKERIEEADLKTITKQKRYIQWATACLVLAVVLIIIIYRSNKKRKALYAALAEKARILSENEKILNETNKTKDKLFSIIGHDLRGPIISLRELVTLSLEDAEEGESYFQKFAPSLSKKLNHLQFTMDNLLNWGQTQMQGATVEPQVIFLNGEVDHIIELFKTPIEEKSITVTNAIKQDTTAYVDPNHLGVILRNLLSNAIKFTKPDGRIDFSARKGKDHVIISIKDNGIGMDMDTLNKVMKNEEHYTSYGTNQEKGTGLGLLLCKEMAQKNFGKIYLKSEKGKGTTFYLELPSSPQDLPNHLPSKKGGST